MHHTQLLPEAHCSTTWQSISPRHRALHISHFRGMDICYTAQKADVLPCHGDPGAARIPPTDAGSGNLDLNATQPLQSLVSRSNLYTHKEVWRPSEILSAYGIQIQLAAHSWQMRNSSPRAMPACTACLLSAPERYSSTTPAIEPQEDPAAMPADGA